MIRGWAYWGIFCIGLSLVISLIPMDPARAFTPLEICPAYHEKSHDILRDRIYEAFAEKDRERIETYLALLQCRIGEPHTNAGERYISVQKPIDLDISPERARGLLMSYWQKQDFDGVVDTMRVGSFEASRADRAEGGIGVAGATDIIRAALMSSDILARWLDDDGAPQILSSEAFLRLAVAAAEGVLKYQENKGDGLFSGHVHEDIDAAAILVDMYLRFGKEKYLEGAQKVIEIYRDEEITPDFPRNAALAYLWMTLSEIDGAKLALAIEYLRVGVFPAMYDSGPFKGDWVDPHTQSLEQRYIIIRYLARILAQLPQDHAFRDELKEYLHIAAKSVFRQYAQNKAFQANREGVRMHCALGEVNMGAEFGVWQENARNFLLSSWIYTQGQGKNNRFLTSPYLISCMLGDVLIH